MIQPNVCTNVRATRRVALTQASGISTVGAFCQFGVDVTDRSTVGAFRRSTVGAFRRNAPTPINAEAHDLEERISENVTVLLEQSL